MENPAPTRRKYAWTPAELGEALGIPPRTIRRLIREGKISARRISGGRRLIIMRDEVDHILEGSHPAFPEAMAAGAE